MVIFFRPRDGATITVVRRTLDTIANFVVEETWHQGGDWMLVYAGTVLQFKIENFPGKQEMTWYLDGWLQGTH